MGRAHGVRGEIRFFPLNPTSELLEPGFRVFVRRAGQETELMLSKVRHASKFDILAFDQVEGRDEAEALTNLELFVDPDDFPELEDGEFYYRDLIGVEVGVLEAEDGDDFRVIGTVDGFLETGANDVMIVTVPGYPDLLVPMIEDAVAEVDPGARVLLFPLEIWAPEDTEIP